MKTRTDIPPKRPVGHDARKVGHDADLVQTGLPVEQDDVAVHQVALDNVARLQGFGNGTPVAELEKFLQPAAPLHHEIGARVLLGTVENQLPQKVGVEAAGFGKSLFKKQI